MASGPLAGGGGAHRWSDSKVYTRKSHASKNLKQAAGAATSADPQASSHQTLAATTTTDDLHSSIQPPPVPPTHRRETSDDEASSLNLRPSDRSPLMNHSGQRRVVTLSIAGRPRHEVREFRRRLTAELDQVREVVKRFEAHELQLSGGGAPSQLSVNGVAMPAAVAKRAPVVSEAASNAPDSFNRHLSVSVPPGIVADNSMSDPTEKEKRTPKANQYYRNSDFVLGKEKFPPSESHSHKKFKGSKKHSTGELDHRMPISNKKLYADVFRRCGTLLQKLMKHKFGWVFNKPVDVKALGLHDYFTIITHPMDLGTVKTRLAKDWYSSPKEFAEDVRLTFQNAMTYNPKGQDVHIMAEQLSKIFAEQWAVIEAEYTYLLRPPSQVPRKTTPPIETRKTLERCDSVVQPMAVDSRSKQVNHIPHIGRPHALKKPKAKDLFKRDMTLEEKKKLSQHLQSLPPEKLDSVVQIIKKRNSSMSQHDDEIEVDIDSMDAETLWELDRFVLNYKKNLSKHKRKLELQVEARAKAEHHDQEVMQGRNPDPVASKVPKKSITDQKDVNDSSRVSIEMNGDNGTGSSASIDSSSDSGSSSSDSGSESS